MTFSQAFLDWEEATEAKGIAIGQREQARSFVIRLLDRRTVKRRENFLHQYPFV